MCGDNTIRNVILATTRWSKGDVALQREREERREQALHNTHWKSLINCGATTARFLSSYASAWTIADLITAMNPPDVLLLQEEIVDLRKEIHETQAATLFYEPVQRELLKLKDSVMKSRKEAETHGNDELK
jgi:hypothetical protein